MRRREADLQWAPHLLGEGVGGEAGETVTEETAGGLPVAGREVDLQRNMRLVGAGWLLTGLAIGITDYPLKFLLKGELALKPSELAGFVALANIPIYIKPLAGILSDAVPLFGTRRRSYLLLGLSSIVFLALMLGFAPHRYGLLLAVYIGFSGLGVVISTVLGGLMVDTALQYSGMGRLSAQRVGIGRFVGLLAGPAGAFLSQYPFRWAMTLCAALYGLLVPLYVKQLREPPTPKSVRSEVLVEVWRQCKTLVRSRTLWTAAGLVALIIAAPGFGTPLLYYQVDVLKFSKADLGVLSLIGGVFGMAGAALYAFCCRRVPLWKLLTISIVVHVVGTLFYLGYRSFPAAIVISAIEGIAQTLAILPLYDLAARATPRGSEALGYSVMMSVWNLTAALSDVAGSYLHDKYHLTILQLVWLNAGTTALILFAIPFLPAALLRRRDGEQ